MDHHERGRVPQPTFEQRVAYAEAVENLLGTPCTSGVDAMERVERVDEALRFLESREGAGSVEERARLEKSRRRVYDDVTGGRWPDDYRPHPRLAPLGN